MSVLWSDAKLFLYLNVMTRMLCPQNGLDVSRMQDYRGILVRSFDLVYASFQMKAVGAELLPFPDLDALVCLVVASAVNHHLSV